MRLIEVLKEIATINEWVLGEKDKRPANSAQL